MIIPLLGYYALFASALSINKLLLSSLSIWFFVALRRLVAGIMLFCYNVRTSPRLRFGHLRHDLGLIAGISVLTMFIPSILKAYGFQKLLSSKAALLGSLDPFITALYAYLLWGEQLTRTKLLGMLVAMSGIVILFVTTTPTEQVACACWSVSLPECAMILSLIISRYGWILARNLLRTNRYSSSEFNSLLMIISGFYALCASYLLGYCDFCSIPPTFNFALLFSYSVLIGEIAGYTIYGNLLKHHNIIFVSLAGLSIPLFVHLMGPLILGEPLSLLFFIELGLVFTGMYIFYRDDLNSLRI